MIDSDEWILSFAGAIVIILLGLLCWFIYEAIKDQERVALFITEHHCKEVERIPQGTTTSLMIVGKIIVPQVHQLPDRVKYNCDNNVTFWRY